MGIAAYNRGSRAISVEILRDAGRYHGDYAKKKPTPRPKDWGEKALSRAVDRAVSILRSNRRYGRDVDFDSLVELVIERERVGRDTAMAAARIATGLA